MNGQWVLTNTAAGMIGAEGGAGGGSYGGFVRCICQGLISRVTARLNSGCQDFLVSSVCFVAAAVILNFLFMIYCVVFTAPDMVGVVDQCVVFSFSLLKIEISIWNAPSPVFPDAPPGSGWHLVHGCFAESVPAVSTLISH